MAKGLLSLLHRTAVLLAAGWVLLLSSPSAFAIEVILRIGELAPEIGTAGYTIESFVEPPSIAANALDGDTYVVFHVTIAGPGVNANNSHVIYRWSHIHGIDKVARGGDVVVFETGTRVLTILESPIVSSYGWVAFTSQMDDLRRGLVLWRPSDPLYGVARTGQDVVVSCESVSGNPCGPVAGMLGSMPTFADRKGMAFAGALTLSATVEHRLAFRGLIQNTGGFGTPDALWFRAFDQDGTPTGPLQNLANSLQKAVGTGSNTTYFDDFTDVALCDGTYPIGLATVSQGPPYAVYNFGGGGVHLLLGRSYAPDAVPRRDLHCFRMIAGFAGGQSNAPVDGDVTKKGVWLVDVPSGLQAQVYSNTVTQPLSPFGATLGIPVGQALAANPYDPNDSISIFAANIIGTPANGRSGIWRGGRNGFIDSVQYETEFLFRLSATVDEIWSAAVDVYGNAVIHLRLTDQRQAIRLVSPSGYGTFTPLLTGDPITIAAGDVRQITTFWMLGGTFGSDPAITGAGGDGLQSAVTPFGDAALIAYYGAAAGGPASSAVVVVDVEVPLFADGYEG